VNYSVVTTSDKSYFPHLKILVNSMLDKCDSKYLKNIYIIDNGLTEEQRDYFLDKSDIIKINTTGLETNFKGGTWGVDWQKNVKGKTIHLYKMISEITEPLLMLDADMLIIKDLHPLLENGGDIQVCVRPNNPISRYIGSYFFSINHEKTLPFIKDWSLLTEYKYKNNQDGRNKAFESPSLVEIVDKYRDKLNIVEIDQSIVNWFLPPDHSLYPMSEETIIVHFKGNSLYNTFDDQFSARIVDSGWYEYIKNYLD